MKVKNIGILALNAGSTSLKSRFFEIKGRNIKEVFKWSKSGIKPKEKNHKAAFRELLKALKKEKLWEKTTAVGHRVVHGGSSRKSVKIGNKEIKLFKKYSSLAPLHNPYNLIGIANVKNWNKKLPQIAVFDTAFYSTIPSYASLYALPNNISKKYGFQRYGFHGTSHNYAAIKGAKKIGKPLSKLKLITVHLGGGCSISAISNGKAIDTSMGFTPLEGLIMGTRSGNIDPGIIIYLAKEKKWPAKKIEELLINKSGLKGLCGTSNMLKVLDKLSRKDKKAVNAFKMFTYQVQKYIGAYIAVLGKCDAIIFTGNIGAGKPITRNRIVSPLKKNLLRKVKIIAIPPNEEEMIALETRKILGI